MHWLLLQLPIKMDYLHVLYNLHYVNQDIILHQLHYRALHVKLVHIQQMHYQQQLLPIVQRQLHYTKHNILMQH